MKEPKMKKQKKIAPVLVSREAMESTVADIVRLKLDHAAKIAAMEKEVAEVQKRHQEAILAVCEDIEIKEASVYTYCHRQRAELFTDKKSIDLLLATVGFETNPPSVQKKSSKDTWPDIARRLQSTEWGQFYVREPAPEVDKEALLNSRATLTTEQLNTVGIRFDQEEQFYIRPKSQVAAETVKQAA
jgi:phage host-nuclease inhibitor protein Gam